MSAVMLSCINIHQQKTYMNNREHIWNNIRSNAWGDIKYSILSDIWTNIDNNVQYSVRYSVEHNVWDNTYNNIRSVHKSIQEYEY